MKEKTTDFGFTQVPLAEKKQHIDAVFSAVAPYYDLMNDVLSMGMHRLWKRYAVSACQIRPGDRVLDLAAGTGDLSSLILSRKKVQMVVSDINTKMLNSARDRLIDEGKSAFFVQANAEQLPFIDNYFDRIIMGFGLRNVTDKATALLHLYRVLKPGGRLIILEFSHPIHRPLAKLYDWYSFHLLPRLGEWVAKDSASYRYLAESIRMHPSQIALKEMLLQSGFDACDYQNLSAGIVAIHQGVKY